MQCWRSCLITRTKPVVAGSTKYLHGAMQREYGTDHTGNGREPAAGTGYRLWSSSLKTIRSYGVCFPQRRWPESTARHAGGPCQWRMRIRPTRKHWQDEPRRHHLAAGKEGTHTTHTEVVDATIPVHVGNGRTRVHRREAGTPSHSMAHDSTKSRKFEDAVALEFGHWDKQAMGVEDIPFVILLPHQKRHGGIRTGGPSGHQRPKPCRRLHTKRST
ncbi:hypothetical protein TcBrA4_0007650 [Trypanosoma cruzi]|nr:hypothetical protein TcBrA4_0007650 [Trypanosoma cruzi]